MSHVEACQDTCHSPLLLEKFLLDPNLMNDRQSDRVASDASLITDNQCDFRDDVIRRDGTCVMTGSSLGDGLQACHIVPHAKGHLVCAEYLLNHHHSPHSSQVPYQSC